MKQKKINAFKDHMYWDMLNADDCFKVHKIKSQMWLYVNMKNIKHLNKMRRDNQEYVLHSLNCVHDNKGLILNGILELMQLLCCVAF